MGNHNKIEKSLRLIEKENLFSRFFKWIANLFHQKEDVQAAEKVQDLPNITIPKVVKAIEKLEENPVEDENSLEYLYRLSDNELEDLEHLYDEQMEELTKEIGKLEEILQSYKKSIKELQNKVETDLS